ncbi:hypothetical protein BDV96DRAFT_594495 [Lophiotrema nucula]|uniref:Uncharacterized protein n=1 Tax=Lophiotrema nucula TaxID=690887 RepID=A0A6A5ZNN8_9PLEO|nr:hypothetical protein BDV96DRAFT_594495 [Lophiotrema nucula]
MLPSAHLLTAPTSLANYKPEDISATALSLFSSTVLLLQVERDLTQEEERMAQPYPRPRSRNDDSDLWFSMPSSARREEEQIRGPEQSAYQATSSRHTSQRSASPSRFPSIPLISTTTAVNKPLPPSPESPKRRRKPASLRSLLRRRPSDQIDPSHLQPEPYQHQRAASTNGSLSPDPYQYYYQQQSSRSMPSSPAEYHQTSDRAVPLIRAASAAANFAEPLSPLSPMNIYFEPQPPRARRTFPESSTPLSPTPNQSPPAQPNRQRPNTWMSPTEPFQDASEFHLFAEATAGLPDGLTFDGISPTSPPHLQPSLFSRGRQNDRIPIPLQHPSAVQSSQPHPMGGWQSMGYDYVPSSTAETSQSSLVSSSALPRPSSYQQSQLSPRINAINMELERLGLSDEEDVPEDELPDYAQSQAEMSAKRRQEATARARELEARWTNSRSWRSG